MHKRVWSQWWQKEMAPTFLSVAWHGEAFHGLGVQSLILIDALSLLDGRRRREEKKKKKRRNGQEWRVFPGARSALLAVERVSCYKNRSMFEVRPSNALQ
jgi:hypothetical protein